MTRTQQSTALLSTGVICLLTIVTGCKTMGLKAPAAANRVRLEHVAINVADPVKMAKWYVEHLDMQVMRQGPPPVNMRFVADKTGNMMLELYHNPPEAVPDYASMDPLLLHVAFLVDDVDAIRDRLIAAGATPVGDVTVTPAGDKLAMLRDPWGLAIQFVNRADPMLSHE